MGTAEVDATALRRCRDQRLEANLTFRGSDGQRHVGVRAQVTSVDDSMVVLFVPKRSALGRYSGEFDVVSVWPRDIESVEVLGPLPWD